MAADDYAVVVGIDRYPGFTDLQAAEFDATQFRDWLVDPQGGAVPAGNVHCVVTSQFPPPPPGQPGKDPIDAAFEPLATGTLTLGRRGRRLYLYLAGHGFSDPRDMNTAAVYTANATPFLVHHVAGTLYAEWFRRNAAFDEIVLIMDCCRSVSDLTGVAPPPFAKAKNLTGAAATRLFYGYATEWGFDTRETLIEGQIRGVFTAALLDALRNAEPDAKGRVTGQRVKDYVHNALGHVSPPPTIEVDSHRDIVFLERAGGALRKVRIQLAAGAKLRIQDGTSTLITEIEAASGIVEIALPQGIYKALTADGGRSHLFEVVSSDVEFTL